MRKDAGVTLTEVTVATAVAVLSATSAVSTAIPFLAREKLRSATYQLQSTMQVSRMEAVARNTPTRFVLNPHTRTVEAWDTKGTTDKSDDELMHQARLPNSVSLASPDDDDAVTLQEDGTSSTFETVFAADGSIAGTPGEISIYGGGEFRKVSLYAAGGVAVDSWKAGEWKHADRGPSEADQQDWEAAREKYEDDWKAGSEVSDPYQEDPEYPDPGGTNQTPAGGMTQ